MQRVTLVRYTAKPGRCHAVGADAVCAVKTDLGGTYCVTVVDIRDKRGALSWRELDAFCALDSIY